MFRSSRGLVPCRSQGCPNYVRAGLKRSQSQRGADGQQYADGETCWRCRQKQGRAEQKQKKERERRAQAGD